MVGVAVWLQIIDAEDVLTAVEPAYPAFLYEPYLFGHVSLYTSFAGFTRYIDLSVNYKKRTTPLLKRSRSYNFHVKTSGLKFSGVIRICRNFIAQGVIHA